MASKTDRLRNILDSSGVKYSESQISGGPVAQKTGTTMADTYFNKAGASTGTPKTVMTGADGNAPRGLNVGDTVKTAGGNYEITNALEGGSSYNPETGYWSRQTTDSYGTPIQTSYTSPWRQQIMDALKGYQDMTYGQWKQGDMYAGLRKDYERQGQRAMQDTLGQMAARTGGMASSYAGSVAQQAYGNYMAALEDAARNLYATDRADQRDLMNLLMGMEDRDYNQWADAYNRQLQQARYGIEDERYADETAYNRGIYADETAYNREQAQLDRDLENAKLMISQANTAYEQQMAATTAITDIIKKLGYLPPSAQWLVNAAQGRGLPSYGNIGSMGVLGGADQAQQGGSIADAVMDQMLADGTVPGGTAGGGGGSYTYTPRNPKQGDGTGMTKVQKQTSTAPTGQNRNADRYKRTKDNGKF